MHNASQTVHEWDVMEPVRSSYVINTAMLFLHHVGINMANYYFSGGNTIVQLDK